MGTALDEAAGAQIGRSVPGISVVVTGVDDTRLEAGFGLADRAAGTAMSPDTVCNWFSMTKLVTATAAVQLADRGLLDLDTPVAEYYEPFAAMRPGSRAQQVSTRHLLGHSAGVANPIPLRWTHLATEAGPPRDELVAGLLEKHRRLAFEPGTKARYSNLGYLVVGEVIAAVTEQPFEDAVRANVLAPLGMERTDFVATDQARWATPYQRRFTMLSALMPVLVPREIIGPKDERFVAFEHFYLDGAAYGGLVGPASDAIRFVRAHLRGGELDGVRLLSEGRCREMQTIATRGRKIEVGLGWFRRGASPDTDFVEHLGGGAGFWNCLRIHPDRGIGVVVMGNATSYDHDAIARAAVGDATSAPPR
jgi:CubicO group peptidase (beta-lactamase class C family)